MLIMVCYSVIMMQCSALAYSVRQAQSECGQPTSELQDKS